MNLEYIKNKGIKLGLEREFDFQLQYVKDKSDSERPLALQALKNAIEILTELIRIDNESKQPTTNQSPSQPS